jgi:hypothetical protein
MITMTMTIMMTTSGEGRVARGEGRGARMEEAVRLVNLPIASESTPPRRLVLAPTNSPVLGSAPHSLVD